MDLIHMKNKIVKSIKNALNKAWTHIDLYKRIKRVEKSMLVRERLIWDRIAGMQTNMDKRLVELKKEIKDSENKKTRGCGGNCNCQCKKK